MVVMFNVILIFRAYSDGDRTTQCTVRNVYNTTYMHLDTLIYMSKIRPVCCAFLFFTICCQKGMLWGVSV